MLLPSSKYAIKLSLEKSYMEIGSGMARTGTLSK
jgi:hypothetical protein